jgi:hypothetical protein
VLHYSAVPHSQPHLFLEFKGTYYLADEAKIVISAVRATYGKRDPWAAFIASQEAALLEYHSRENAAPPYVQWLVRARLSQWRVQASQRSYRRDEYVLSLSS